MSHFKFYSALFKTNDFDEFIKRQDDLRELYSECHQHLNEDMKHEIQTYISVNFRANINVVIPEYYKSLEQWVLGLYQEIVESKVYIQDYKQIENYLKNKRLNEVYALLDFVCQYKKIPNKKNNALELDLIRMLLKFDLQHIFSLFWYQAKFASDRLRTLELSGDEQSRFMKDFVFSKKIATYLDYLEKVNEKPKFPRSLPENWSYSDIEVFISAHIIGNYEKWEKFTPSEILTLWEEAKGIDEEQISA